MVLFPDRVLVSVCKDRASPAVAQCLWLIQLSLPMLCNSGCQAGYVMATHSANWLLVCAWDHTSLARQPLPSALRLLRNRRNAEGRGWRARLGSHLLTAGTACV